MCASDWIRAQEKSSGLDTTRVQKSQRPNHFDLLWRGPKIFIQNALAQLQRKIQIDTKPRQRYTENDLQISRGLTIARSANSLPRYFTVKVIGRNARTSNRCTLVCSLLPDLIQFKFLSNVTRRLVWTGLQLDITIRKVIIERQLCF